MKLSSSLSKFLNQTYNSAFRCVITKSGKVYWRTGGDDAYYEILADYTSKDKELQCDAKPPFNTYALVRFSPPRGNYFDNEHKWKCILEKQTKPNWWNTSYYELCYKALEQWQKKVYSQINLKEVQQLTNPFTIKPPQIKPYHILLLKLWEPLAEELAKGSLTDSVWESIDNSVGSSISCLIWCLLKEPILGPIWKPMSKIIRQSVTKEQWKSEKRRYQEIIGSTIIDSATAYAMIIFRCIDKEKYFGKTKYYPPQIFVDFWKQGLVPICFGGMWRIFGGTNAKILFEISTDALKEYHID